MIRFLEERFQGLCAPFAEGGFTMYSITDTGRAELASCGDEIRDAARDDSVLLYFTDRGVEEGGAPGKGAGTHPPH